MLAAYRDVVLPGGAGRRVFTAEVRSRYYNFYYNSYYNFYYKNYIIFIIIAIIIFIIKINDQKDETPMPAAASSPPRCEPIIIFK